jgi:hypothetical protein
MTAIMDAGSKFARLQFSLLTLFVALTVFAMGLGWELSVVRERKAWRRAHQALIREAYSGDGALLDLTRAVPHIPWWRSLMGDTPVAILSFPEGWADSDCDHAVRLFPEAYEVWRERRIGGETQLYIYKPGQEFGQPAFTFRGTADK